MDGWEREQVITYRMKAEERSAPPMDSRRRRGGGDEGRAGARRHRCRPFALVRFPFPAMGFRMEREFSGGAGEGMDNGHGIVKGGDQGRARARETEPVRLL